MNEAARGSREKTEGNQTRRRAIVALIGTTVSLMMCMPTGAFAQDTQSNDDDIHTSAQLRAEAAEQNADQERQLLEESTQNESDIVPLAEDSSYPAPWNEGTDTGVKDQPAQVAGVSSMQDDTVRGVNPTSYQAMKAARTAKNGYAFKDFDGNNLDDNGMMQLLKASGINYVLLKVAVNPTDGNGNTYGGGNPTLDNAIAAAKAAQANGLNVNIQFLYSDFYTSKTVQKLPKGWPANPSKLTGRVSDYTADSLSKLKAAGVTPNTVTIGSEISSPYYADSENKKDLQGGFLGQDDWKGMSQLISAASKAIRANNAGTDDRDTVTRMAKEATQYAPKGTKMAVRFMHTDSGSADFALNYFKEYKLDYDVYGSTYYPFWSSGSDGTDANQDPMGALIKLEQVVTEKYKKEFAVIEFSYLFTENDSDGGSNNLSGPNIDKNNKYPYQVSVQGQADVIHDTLETVTSADGGTGFGLGAFYDPDSNAWYWADADGTIACDKDVFIPKDESNRAKGGKWVRYDPVTGIMVHGLDRRNGAWDYFDQYTGKMAHGRAWVPEWRAWHHFDEVTGRG